MLSLHEQAGEYTKESRVGVVLMPADVIGVGGEAAEEIVPSAEVLLSMVL